MRDEEAIFEAIENGDLERVRHLVENKATLIHEPYPGLGDQPLHVAASGRRDIVAFLLDHGADINARGSGGMTPLHHAARRGYQDIAELLLDRGADIDAEDHSGFTPLFSAARGREPECSQVAELLEARGARIGLNDLLCLGHVERVKDMLGSEPDACKKAKFPGYLVEDMVTLIQCRIWEKSAPAGEDPAAAEEIIAECLPVLAKMLDQGADPDGGFRTAMTYAVQLPTSDVARLLLERGASPTHPKYDLLQWARTAETRELLKEYRQRQGP